MKTRLISYSTPSKDMIIDDIDGMKELVAFCARVSNPDNQTATDTMDRLLNYLMEHKHWSPFEMVNVCIEIETTRDIARQILRHRSFSFQEFSQRYADPTKELEFVWREARLQDAKNRQASVDIDDGGKLQNEWNVEQQKVILASKQAYQWAIDNGIAKEQARSVLPEGNTVSRMYMNGTLRSWLHYIDLRTEAGTQKEHREIARHCAEVIAEVYPNIMSVVRD